MAADDAAGTEIMRFRPVERNQRLSDKVADLILETIVSQRLQPGDRLPSERELGDQFGVSRTVIREAARSLAAKGVVEIRTGSGLRVAANDAAAVSESMNVFLRINRALDYPQINEVRMMIEMQTAGLAAARASDEQITELDHICARMAEVIDDVEKASAADVEFHRAVARATGNELFLVMLDSIGEVLLEVRRATLGVRGRAEAGVKAHRKIVAQIAAHDVEGACEAMREHLVDSRQAWQRLRAPDGAHR